MTERLRVVTVATSYPRWDGDFAGHFIAALAEELASRGHAISVVAPHAPDVPDEETRSGVRVTRARYLPGELESLAYGHGIMPNLREHPSRVLEVPMLARALRSQVKREAARGCDVLHVHWGPTAQLCGARKAGVPVLLSLHGTEVSKAEHGGMWARVLQASTRHADAVNVMAESQEKIVRARTTFGGPVEVVPSGIPLDLVEREREAGDPETVSIVFVGRLVPEKGIEDLAEVFARLAPQMPQLRLVVVGTGPSDARVREAVEAAGVGSAVEFLGRVEHARALDAIATADLLALPSHGEGSPLSVTEALALGTPVVTSDVGALPGLVGDAGLVVPAGDLDALQVALERLASDASLRTEMGQRGRDRIASTHVWPVIADRVEALYHAAIELRAAKAR